MSGNPDKAGRWPQCDVWVAPKGTTFPADPSEDPGNDFDLIGYLDGSAGVVKSMDEDNDKLKAWGGATIDSVNTFNGESFAFTAIEDNDVVWGVVYAGSDAPTTATGVTTRVAKVPKRGEQAWLIRLSRSDGTKKDYQVPLGVARPSGDVTENETDLGGTEITVDVLSNSSDELHTEVIKTAS